jgi:hypothetical protein
MNVVIASNCYRFRHMKAIIRLVLSTVSIGLFYSVGGGGSALVVRRQRSEACPVVRGEGNLGVSHTGHSAR